MDEWGVYDPQQAGLSALFARLDSRSENSNPQEDSPAIVKDTVPVPERPTLRDAK